MCQGINQWTLRPADRCPRGADPLAIVGPRNRAGWNSRWTDKPLDRAEREDRLQQDQMTTHESTRPQGYRQHSGICAFSDARGGPVTLAAIAAGLLLLAPAQAADEVATCTTCHHQQAEELGQSVHTELRCQECHRGQDSYTVPGEDLNRFQLRPPDSNLSFDHGSAFAGKPTRFQVPEACGHCHEDVARMNPYGLRTDQLSRYWTSGHGRRLKNDGDERVAVCIDCHGVHEIQPGRAPQSKTHPFNVPETCATCHGDAELMTEYDLPVEIVDEYRASVHGELLFEQHDSGAPTCATCHGNHSAMPPGFASVGAVCGKCHAHTSEAFAKSVHEGVDGHHGCVQCHGGGEHRHFHYIERITKPPGLLIQRYAHLLQSESAPTSQQITEAIDPGPKQIIMNAVPSCTECHDELEEDANLHTIFNLLDQIADAERRYVQTARRLEDVGHGMLLVDKQRFKFEDAKTHLIALAPLQHTLDTDLVAAKVTELNAVCEEVSSELDELEAGLRMRYIALGPMWGFALLFSVVLYIKYKQLRKQHVTPVPRDASIDG